MKKDIVYISTELILPNQYQPRKVFNEESISELAESIKSYGIIQPLTVRKTDDDHIYELIAGERRLRAAKKAGLKEVPTIIVELEDNDSAAIALLENLQREDLNFFEEALAYHNLIKDHGYTQEQLAELIGKKQSTIANKLRILKLDKEIIDKLINNKLTERHARALLKLPDKEIQMAILDIIIEKGLNVSKTEQLIEKELLKLSGDEDEDDGKKRIKGIFNAKIYVNTIKQVFDKYGINANYRSKELDDSIQVTITIKKK